MPLVPLAEVQALVLDSCEMLEPVDLELRGAFQHVLAVSVVAPEDVPRFDNTAMDGFALHAGDTSGGAAVLRVVGTLAAGQVWDEPIGEGEALRIMTGAPIPKGADAVVMIELTKPSADGATVLVEHRAAVGENRRAAGSDLRAGAVVAEPGTVLSAGHLGMLASIGVGSVSVRRRPRVGIFSTGDELVPVSAPLEAGQIRDSNRPSLLACLERDGFEIDDFGILADREEDVSHGVESALASCDAVITSGGVSAGDFDYVKVVLAEVAERRGGFMRSLGVAIKPAKPFAFGVIGSAPGVPVFGLPGNPVSSLVSYELFARPALRKMAGHVDPLRRAVRGVAGEDLLRQQDGKLHLQRVVVHHGEDGRLVALSAGGQGSHQLGAMAAANALALLPDGDGVVAGGNLDLLVLDCP